MEPVYRVLRSNVKHNLLNGIYWAIGFNAVTPFIPILAAKFGATSRDYALLSSVPALLSILVTLPASLILDRLREQKRIISWVIAVSRLCYFLTIFIPYLPFSKIGALIALVGAYTAMSAIFSVAYQSMMGEVIPAEYRNKVFAQRNFWTGVTGMAVALLAGWGMDRFPYPYGYQAAFTLGFIASLVETWYFNKLRIPSEELPPAPAASQTAATLADDRPVSVFRSFADRFSVRAGWPFYLFCLSAVVYIFAWQAAWPIYNKIKADTLHATNTMISIDAVLGAIGSLLAFRPWARLADRKGNGLTVFFSALALGLTPFCWMYAPSMNWVYLFDLLGGFTTAGFTQSVFNRVLEIVPHNTRQRAIAFYTTLSQVSAIFAPIVGMYVYERLAHAPSMALIGTARMVGAVCFLIILLPKKLRSPLQADRAEHSV